MKNDGRKILKLSLPAEREHLDLYLEPLTNALRDTDINKSKTNKIILAVEEALVNVMSYAYPEKNKDDRIGLEVDCMDNIVVVKITDSGVAFNPLEKEEPDLTKPAVERAIGGLGLTLIKNYTDNLEYKRICDKNIFSLIFNN